MIEVPVVVHELLRAATGHPIVVRTLDGQQVRLRLPTPAEALRLNEEARATVAAMIGRPVSGPAMTQEQAEQLCRPLRWPV